MKRVKSDVVVDLAKAEDDDVAYQRTVYRVFGTIDVSRILNQGATPFDTVNLEEDGVACLLCYETPCICDE